MCSTGRIIETLVFFIGRVHWAEEGTKRTAKLTTERLKSKYSYFCVVSLRWATKVSTYFRTIHSSPCTDLIVLKYWRRFYQYLWHYCLQYRNWQFWHQYWLSTDSVLCRKTPGSLTSWIPLSTIWRQQNEKSFSFVLSDQWKCVLRRTNECRIVHRCHDYDICTRIQLSEISWTQERVIFYFALLRSIRTKKSSVSKRVISIASALCKIDKYKTISCYLFTRTITVLVLNHWRKRASYLRHYWY